MTNPRLDFDIDPTDVPNKGFVAWYKMFSLLSLRHLG